MDALLGLAAAAVADFRDVLTWARGSEPTPEERAAARAGIRAMVRGHDQARRQYLEANYGIEGATRIERSNCETAREITAVRS